jgi:hypothetical protein
MVILVIVVQLRGVDGRERRSDDLSSSLAWRAAARSMEAST